MIEINKFYNMDGIKGLEQIYNEHGSIVDAIITDPPYNISEENNFKSMNRAGIDFGEWDKNFDITGWIKPAVNVLKKGGNIVIFVDWKSISYVIEELEACGCMVKKLIRWRKTNPMPRNKDRLYVESCEYAIWATKGKGWIFNRQSNTYENGEFIYPIVSGKERIHETQKPWKLMKDILMIHTNENDLVVEPFAGSGSTIKACVLSNRRYIAFEKGEDCFNRATKSLDDFIKNNNL